MFVLMSVIELQYFFQSHDLGDYEHCNSVPGVKVIFHSQSLQSMEYEITGFQVLIYEYLRSKSISFRCSRT